ncbi:DUF559 domain-containing protein [Brachybacterium sp. UNK5269]|uniref:DUF559 domain-containing protein n=1 Tax=Brachybacterium sp. UNK5269 TaxID=3408576 RepID=UPI003BB0AE32
MVPRWSPKPRSLHRRADLLVRGVHPRRLASTEFIEVIPGWCTPSDAPARLEVIARTLQRSVLPGAVICHATAAELLEVPLPREHEYAQSLLVHCLLPPGRPRRRPTPRLHVHTGPDRPSSRIRGVAISGPVALLAELSRTLSHTQLVAAADQLVGPHSRLRPRPTAAQLRDLVAAATGTYRITRVRRAVALARDRVESPKETETRLLLLHAGFAEPVINLEVRAPLTGETFRLDLSYPALRLAIEYDGFWHSTDRVRHRRDRRKDDVLHELGWRVVRASDADLADPHALLGRLRHLQAPLARA